MTPRAAPLAHPRVWTSKELQADLIEATAHFRRSRMEEPLDAYLEKFDTFRGHVEDLLETTIDLTTLSENAVTLLADPDMFFAVRYLAGPPTSKDDLQTIVEATLSPAVLKRDPAVVKRVIETIRSGLDRARFPWLAENREPTDAEREAAVVASAALMATQRLSTVRRNQGKEEQEKLVRQTLLDFSFQEVKRRKINTLGDAPKAGQFCMESQLGQRKADVVVGLWDGRTLPLECKVSNSATNSIKRLNNDAAAKAEFWIQEFGTAQVVPGAVLSGVYSLTSLENAQTRKLALFWSHRLTDLTAFIGSTK